MAGDGLGVELPDLRQERQQGGHGHPSDVRYGGQEAGAGPTVGQGRDHHPDQPLVSRGLALEPGQLFVRVAQLTLGAAPTAMLLDLDLLAKLKAPEDGIGLPRHWYIQRPGPHPVLTGPGA
ncbi:MAG: hypothetical protein AB7I59_31525 [Geminicoccaceae bacterium]